MIVPEITSWTSVDTGGANGKNFDLTKAGTSPKLVTLGTKMYATWIETDGSATQVRAAVYNGNNSSPGWAFVDGNATTGLNKNTTRSASAVFAVVLSDKLYLAWHENNAGAVAQIRVAVYNGNDSSPAWTFVDGNGVDGLNKSTALAATFPRLAVLSGKLYLTWQENTAGAVGQIRVAVYNGNDSAPSWAFVDGNGANGLNKSTALYAATPSFGILGTSLYLTWSERNAGNVFQVRAAIYNGNDSSPSWSFIDGNGANGLNFSTARVAKIPVFATLDSKLYLFFRELNASAITQMRVAVYNGNDSAPSWTFVDGNGANGINVDVTHLVGDLSVAVANSRLYACWSEQNAGGIYQSRVKVYSGNDSSPSWASVDGANSSSGINKNAANSGVNISCNEFNSAFYATWSEGATGQIMISVGQ